MYMSNLLVVKEIRPVYKYTLIMINIIREYPQHKDKKYYTSRITEEAFHKYDKITTSEFISRYNMWKSGINPNTNRKIKINGKVHEKLKYEFQIKYICSNGRDSSIIFEKLNDIKRTEYIEKTKLDILELNSLNSVIDIYNKSVDTANEKIKKIDKWDMVVEFDGNPYGTPIKVINHIHIENNCGGVIVFIREETKYFINDRPFCNYSDGETTYNLFKCKKCNYKYSDVKNSIPRGGYVSNTGFYWK
jgi:hypothetical protein